MTVKELKELLEQFDESKEVTVCINTFLGYVYEPAKAKEQFMRSAWGNDRSVITLFCPEQTGAI